uniref:Uncharacterized protein n=1 Tax=Trypanosoma vivax (strain Y486) TaxID=1055687 RepID=G0UBN4_TRYVY|nr:hypothetical protein, unlikely [Trypanosoma vivax Y486]
MTKRRWKSKQASSHGQDDSLACSSPWLPPWKHCDFLPRSSSPPLTSCNRLSISTTTTPTSCCGCHLGPHVWAKAKDPATTKHDWHIICFFPFPHFPPASPPPPPAAATHKFSRGRYAE